MEVARDKLINLIKNEEANLRSHKAAGRSKECMEFLWSTTDNVGHVLLEEPELLTKITARRCSSHA
jgi:hypothetical protein